jgi:hypothetical protein
MKFQEFGSKKNKKVDEVNPTLAAVGQTAVQGIKAVGQAVGQGVKTVGQAVGQGAKTVGQAAGSAATQAAKKATGQQTTTQQPIPLKVGTLVPFPNPIGRIKVNKIDQHGVWLDTQQKLGMNIKVDPAELGNYMQTLQGKVSGK